MNTEFSTVKLNEKLPWPPYQMPGDYSTAMLLGDGFNIILSLTNLSPQEEKAIGDDEFEIYLTAFKCVPFIVLKFGDVLKSDFTLNIAKLNPESFQEWIQADKKAIAIYLLEGSNATLKCVRYFDFPHMQTLRTICSEQRNYTPESINVAAQQIYARFTTETLLRAARYVDTIPAVEYHI